MAKCAVCKDDLGANGTLIDYTSFREVKGRRLIHICGGCMDDLYGGSK